MSYGNNLPDTYRLIGTYAARIVKGAKAADLPVLQPIKFEFVLNCKVAKALGLTIPAGVLSIVEEVHRITAICAKSASAFLRRNALGLALALPACGHVPVE